MDSFYLTLPSNSSMGIFLDNKTSMFTTKLANHIKLDGDWVVALVEVHYPNSFWSVNHTNQDIWYAKEDEMNNIEVEGALVKLKAGNYLSVHEIVVAINSIAELKGRIHLDYHFTNKTVLLKIIDKDIGAIKFCSTLNLILGFDAMTLITKRAIESPSPASIQRGLPKTIFIYTDIIKHQLVGDSSAPLLGIINIDSGSPTYGSNGVIYINAPHYIPLSKKSFETIEIDLRNDVGDPIPFEFGTSIIKLHFKRA